MAAASAFENPRTAVVNAVPLVIGVHGGRFHVDDAMCCAMLSLHPRWRNATIARSNNPVELFEKCDIVCDVGGMYDHSRHLYDHHQRGFAETFSPKWSAVKMAASGLVYRHHGKKILSAAAEQPLSSEQLDAVRFHLLFARRRRLRSGVRKDVRRLDRVCRRRG